MAAILVLFFLSGISGLIYQVVWMRLLTHVLGGSSLAVSTVLAVFMGGLALGSRLFGTRVDGAPRPLRLYAQLELGIALFAVLVPFLVVAIQPFYVNAARMLPVSAWIVPRLLVAVGLLLPPTILMGGTLPVLGRFLVRSNESLGRRLGTLYAVNTAGAVLGAFLAGFYLVEAVGLVGGTFVAAGGNVVAALFTLVIDRRQPPMPSAPAPESGSGPGAELSSVPPAAIPLPLLAFLFAASGFAALGYEIYWTRALQVFLGNTTYAFSAMLTTFLVGLAGGSWLGGQLVDRVANRGALLGWIQIAIGAAALATVPLIWNWLPGLQETAFLDGRYLDWSQYLRRRFGVAFVVMALPTLLLGMTFPVVTRLGIRELSRIGSGIGSLYFANTTGAILGSLVGGFLIVPWLGAKGAILVTGLANVTIGIVAHASSRPRRPASLGAAVLVGALLVALAPHLASSTRILLSDTQAREDRVLFDKEDSFAETRIYEKPNGERHMSVNGHHIGGTNATTVRKEKILAHLPMVLVPRAERVLLVGLGSGITLGTFALYAEIEELDCIEIAPAVVEGASFFTDQHGAVLDEPRVHIVVEDGVQFLLNSTTKYDVISSDSKLNPSYVGNAPLLSRDYYELCRNRLSAQGVLVQWLPAHVPLHELQTIIRGVVQAFPHTAVFWYDPSNMILVGALAPVTVDMDRARAFTEQPAIRADLESLHLESPYVLASLYVSGDDALVRVIGPGPVTTWRHPRLEFTLVRASREKDLPAREDATLRWLAEIRHPESVALRGHWDDSALERFRISTTQLLRGFAAGGGVERLDTGSTYFQEGLAANPEDRRLSIALSYLGRMPGEAGTEK